jgi:hypothetical protein
MTLQRLFTILLFFIISCKDKDRKNQVIATNQTLLDTTKLLQQRPSNKIDTSIYKPLKFGFYKTSKGDIFELKKSVEEDSLGFYDTFWLDSTLIDGEYSNRKLLKDYFDIESYSNDTISNFSKDKNHVYYVQAQSGGHIRFIVDKADAKAFIGLKDRWGKDSRYVFYQTEIVKNADLNSFEVYKNSNDTAKDKKHIFCRGEKIR